MRTEAIRETDFSYLVGSGASKARIIGSESIINQAMGTEAVTQLLNMAELPGRVGLPTGLPDIHQGYGFPIGSVIAFDSNEGIVSPGGVGYDINCGTIHCRNVFFRIPAAQFHI